MSAVVLASVTPSRIVMNVKRLSGCCQCESKVVLETVTLPNGDPPVGGAKIPLITRGSSSPVGVTTTIGEPTVRSWSFA